MWSSRDEEKDLTGKRERVIRRIFRGN